MGMPRPGQAAYRRKRQLAEQALKRSAIDAVIKMPSGDRKTTKQGASATPRDAVMTENDVPDIVQQDGGEDEHGDDGWGIGPDDEYSESYGTDDADDDEAHDGDSLEVAEEGDSMAYGGEQEDEEDEITFIEGKKRKRASAQRPGESRRERNKDEFAGPKVLPVANLPEDWEGVVEDGATYLAVAARANKALPTYTRVPNPWGTASDEEIATSASRAHAQASQQSTSGVPVPPAQPEAGPSRHPALPKESWQAVFPLHFVAYKKRLAEDWPPSPRLPYPSGWPAVPSPHQRFVWGHYINGYPRKLVPAQTAVSTAGGSAGAGKGKGPSGKEGTEGGATAVSDEGEVDMEVDEEEMMNLEEEAVSALPALPDVLEQLAEKHKPREPHVCILQRLDTPGIISVLSVLTSQIQNALAPLEDNLIPPDYDPTSSSTGSYGQPRTRANPFTDRYARWIFALLSVLDPFLSAQQVSVLRELARAVMRVGAWRWVQAVMSGEAGLRSVPAGLAEGEGEEAPVPWVLGARWKYARDQREVSGALEGEMRLPAKEQVPAREREEYDERGIDETLARCWMVVHAVAAGWGQSDLIMDLESTFSS